MAQVDSKWEKLLKKSQPSDFSEEIMFDILSRLPVKSILRFKCVCKKWYKLFGDSSFIEGHLKLSVEGSNYCYLIADCFNQSTARVGFYLSDDNFEDFRKLQFETEPSCCYDIVASTNGLVCITKLDYRCEDKSCVLLWNPVTRELRTIPECPGIHHYNTAVGFGYDQKNNDYKLAIMTSFEESTITRVDVYSLRNDRWKSFEVDKFEAFHNYGAHVNGRLHWLARTLSSWSIVSFDLTYEKIIEMGLPVHLNHGGVLRESPESLGKSLIFSFSSDEEGIEIWFMKKYGDSKSWSKLYFSPHPIHGLGYPCFILQNGKVIMQGSRNNNMFLYDPKNHVDKILAFNGNADIVRYTESLVSVEGGLSICHRKKGAAVRNL